MTEIKFTDSNFFGDDADGGGEVRALVSRALLQVTADLAAETASRTALSAFVARASDMLADAGVSADLVAGVEQLVALCAGAHRAMMLALADVRRVEEMRDARDLLLAEVDRLRTRIVDIERREAEAWAHR